MQSMTAKNQQDSKLLQTIALTRKYVSVSPLSPADTPFQIRVACLGSDDYDYDDVHKKRKDDKAENGGVKGIIAQQKMDGDRMQAHIMMD